MKYYATLGYTPRVLLAVKDHLPHVGQLTVFHGDLNRKQVKALETAETLLEELGVPFGFAPIERPWNIEACLQAFFSRFAADGRPSDLIVNASGGTEVMNAAATVFAMFAGCRVEFMDRHSWKVTQIDFPAVRAALSLDGKRRQLFEALVDAGGEMDLAALPGILDVTPGAVTQHVQRLGADGLLRLEPKPEGRGKRVRLEERLRFLRLR